MSTTTTARSNAPRPPTPAEVKAYLEETCADLIARRDEILAGAERFHTRFPTITDDDTQGKAGDFAGAKGAMAGFAKIAEGRRTEAKQPYDQAGNTVQTFFKSLTEPVARARTAIGTKMNAYADRQEEIRREAARKDAEAAAALAREAERIALQTMAPAAIERAATVAKDAERAEAHVSASSAEHTRTSGMHTTTSVHTRWTFDEAESDLSALVAAAAKDPALLKYLAFNNVRIGIAVRSEGLRTLPGCTIKQERSVR